MKNKYQTFLINLDKSTQRLSACDAMLKSQGISYERMPAVYGADLTEAHIAKVYSSKKPDSFYKTLGAGEIGCYLSHINVWNEIIARQLDYAVILEDDISIASVDFNKLMESVASFPSEWHYIKLLARGNPKFERNQACGNGFNLVTYKKVPTRTGAQIVSREGAKRLLASCQPFGRPIDVDLRYWWEKNIVVQGLMPYAFVANHESESEIAKLGNRKKGNKKPIKGVLDKLKYYALMQIHGLKLK
ncbi:MAG: glycosyl transferase family 25 [Lentisphaeria bacterium]|jgi:glycosyl transferase family 25